MFHRLPLNPHSRRKYLKIYLFKTLKSFLFLFLYMEKVKNLYITLDKYLYSSVENLEVIENNGQRGLTTQQLADSYETSNKRISDRAWEVYEYLIDNYKRLKIFLKN